MNTVEDEKLYRHLSYATSLSDDGARITMELPPIGLVVGFALLSASFAFVAALIIRCNWYCREFYEWNAIRLTMPGLCLLLSIKNATMAYTYASGDISSMWSIVIYMISSVIAPGEGCLNRCYP